MSLLKGGEKLQFAEIMTASIMGGTDVSASRTGSSQSRSYAGRTAEFGKVLETTISRVQNRSDVNRANPARRNDSSDIRGENRLQRPQSSRGGRTGRLSVYDAEGSRKTEAPDMDGSQDTEKTGRNVTADMLEVLALLTGIDRMTLKEMLTALGIPEEVLSAREGFDGIAAGISEMLGLDAMQKEALTDLMQLMEEALEMPDASETATGKDTGQSAGATQSGMVREGTGFPEAVKNALVSSSEISRKLREEILRKKEENASMPDADGSAADEGVRDAILNMLEKVQFGRSNASGAAYGPVTETEQASEEVSVRSKAKAFQTEEAENDGTDDSGSVEKHAMMQDAEAIHDEVTDSGMIAIEQMSYETNAAVRIPVGRAADQAISARQIISQVAEKASVILAHDKSEMVIELKPESLGRLSLKVVTENGIVMARFVAENSQVQRLLESNMQMLRESLERQGIVVQDLSVSVRQDGGQARENGPQNRGLPGLRPKGFAPTAAVGMPDVSWTAEATGINDPWMWQGSTINLTA